MLLPTPAITTIVAMADEMHNFYEEEDLYMYEEGSTPSLEQASLTGIVGEDAVLVTKDDLEQQLAAAMQAQVRHWFV